MANYTLVSRNELANLKYAPTSNQTQIWNALGRDAGTQQNNDDNFFVKRGKSIENALGTTGASLVSAIDTATENANTEQRNKNYKDSLKNIAQKYGYNSMSDFYDASNAADRDILSKYNFDFDSYNAQRQEAANKNDQAKLDELDKYKLNFIENNITGEDANKLRNFTLGSQELRKQASGNLSDATKAAEDWKNYRENSYVGQKINQDRGKFAGSAINTLSTAVDLTGLGANPISNAIQGGVEGIADELEQNGLQNFDAGRAAQNAAIGAAAGAVTGALNKGISNSLAKKGGNLFKGNNAITAGLNSLGSKTALGRGVSTIATGVGRGAVSGAVGGATGAGLSAALNGQDVLGSAVEGAKRGLTQGAAAGGIMAGANLALNNTPGVGKFMQDLNSAKTNWDNSGNTFDERLTNTLNSGDSAVGNWLNRQSQSRALATMGNIGNRVQNVNATTGTGDAWDRLAQQSGYNNYDEVIQRYMEANPGVELNPNGAAGQILTWLDENPNTPTTAAGWAKRAGERIIEDANNSNLGMRVKDLSNELPEDIRNMSISDNTKLPVETETSSIARQQNVVNETNKLQPTKTSALAQAQGEANDLTKVFDPESLKIENKNKLQSIGQQLQTTAKTQKYAALYDSLDGKTAERAIKTNAPDVLAEMGVRPENYLEAAKTSNYVNSVVSDLAEKSGVKVTSPDLVSKLNAASDDVIFTTPDAQKKFNTAIRQIVADGSSPDEYSAGYLLAKSRDFSNKAAKLRGNAADVDALRTAYTNAKYVLRDEATNALANANITGDLTNDNIAKGLKEMGANQKVVDYYTAPNDDGSAPNASDYIRRTSYFEQARDMGNQVAAEKLTRSASKQPTNMMTRIWRASGLDQPVETLLRNTVAPAAAKATDLTGKALEGVGNLASKTGNNLPTTTETSATQVMPGSLDIYNAIGRTEGEIQGDKARTAQYLANATNMANTQNDTLESLAAPNTGSSTMVANAIQPTASMGTQNASTATTQQTNSNQYFQPTGDYWTDLLGNAMAMAIDADDVDAFISLYGMYQDALSQTQKSSGKDYSDVTNWSSADRTKLLSAQNAMDQIDQLESAYNDATGGEGGNAVQGWLRSRAADLSGGNWDASAANYNSLAKSVGMGIVKNLINLGVTEADAQRYLEYLPALTDTQEQAQQKLSTLRNIYQSQINNLYSAYGL